MATDSQLIETIARVHRATTQDGPDHDVTVAVACRPDGFVARILEPDHGRNLHRPDPPRHPTVRAALDDLAAKVRDVARAEIARRRRDVVDLNDSLAAIERDLAAVDQGSAP